VAVALTQTHNHASIPPLSFFTGQMPFLLPSQRCQRTEGTVKETDFEDVLRQWYIKHSHLIV